ncbi:copia-type polyprotein, partial [Trifolium medium]|nr:copia-type polyprotein [Trifolium medium]
MSSQSPAGSETFSWNYIVRSKKLQTTAVYCDNVSAIYLSGNPVQYQRTKHIEMDIHYVREKIARGQVRVLHVPSRYQIADIF